jgi:hypothetical protein
MLSSGLEAFRSAFSRHAGLAMTVFLAVFMAVILGGGITGCASRNVDPRTPGSHVGYLDFYADPPGPLSWHVEKINAESGSAHTLFQQYAPMDDRVLRLAVKPGTYHLRITFFNLVTEGPAETVAEVKATRITPVKITLVDKGTVTVETKQTRAGGTYYGRFGRSTKLEENQTTRFEVLATAEPGEEYRLKAAMPYGHPAEQAK